MGKLLFQGHGSYRIITNEGIVIYVEIILAYLIQRAGIIKKCAFAV